MLVKPFAAKYKQGEYSLVPGRPGYVLFEMLPYSAEPNDFGFRTLDVEAKQSFVLLARSISEIFGIRAGDARPQTRIINYNPRNEKEFKVMKIQKQLGELQKESEVEEDEEDPLEFEFHLFDFSEETVKNHLSVTINFGEFIVLRKLLEYALPYVVGWGAVEDLIIKEDYEYNNQYDQPGYKPPSS